ncbi:cell death 5 [Octopus vulgaris]|uniref:Cell death 5 n=3 Tax=Octopus TaxID=6643 RepID=A0AA36BPZ4_OCTVU|nr:programmed cell death protein 5 [Octopus bimaculoides]XP_029647297.1 programmed cell death protein 5-like [Octopus sinensis]CAI9737742.1 cell death 5 [Octopus vulgaris]|eukprot:XP_014784025.1 PREDICTED: programmed cell death protein 5-like [Octopus bimaculoides]
MADPELEAIRARRMAELQRQSGMSNSNHRSKEETEQKLQQQEELRNSILSQVLDQSARARLNTIAVAKPEKAKMVESMLCQMATSGQIAGKLSENHLISLLEQVSEQTQRKTTVKFDRRRVQMDDSDDDY